MPPRLYLLLFILGLASPVFIAQYQSAPGYLDSDYYFAGGIQLATGKGFTEPYLWNYLDGTTSLPHPSHSYWQPLASIVAALGMILTGKTDYASARLFFFLIAALVPPITAALAYTFSKRRDLAFTSGLFAIFSVYNASFVGVTDNFGIFMLLGGLYFLVATQLIEDPSQLSRWFTLGLLAGLMTIARSDGLLWLAITFLFILFRITHRASPPPITNYQLPIIFTLLGFFLVMFPWYMRNFNAYGSFMVPGGSRALWLTNYDQTFIYPPSALSQEAFLAQGWHKILADRMSAFVINLESAFAAHGGIILFPFIVAGFVYYRKDERVKLAGVAWLILFFVMTFLFPFAGARGAFFHAGAALQPIWWALAPLGLESILNSLQKRGIGHEKNRFVFRSLLIMTTIILSIFVVNLRLFKLGWGEGEDHYPAVEKFLVEKGIGRDDIVLVRNAPGYYLETGRAAISVPYGGEQAILQVAEQFKARYLAFESKVGRDSVQGQQFIYLGETNGAYIYKIQLK